MPVSSPDLKMDAASGGRKGVAARRGSARHKEILEPAPQAKSSSFFSVVHESAARSGMACRGPNSSEFISGRHYAL